MDLIFTDTNYRQQGGSEVLDYGFKVRCTNLTSRTVTIPTGLHYFDGEVKRSPAWIFS